MGFSDRYANDNLSSFGHENTPYYKSSHVALICVRKGTWQDFTFKVGGKEGEQIIIPEEIDSLLIEFNAKLTPGELSTTTHGMPNILRDSILVGDYSLTEVVPIKFKMIRHDTKRKHPVFLVW